MIQGFALGGVRCSAVDRRGARSPAEELLDALGISGSILGGNLSSVGFGMRYFPEYEWAFGRHDGLYVMPSEVADIIKKCGL